MLGGGTQVHLDHIVGRLLLIHLKTHDKSRVVVDVSHKVKLAATHPDHHDVALPHLVRRAPLEPPRLTHVLFRLATHRLRSYAVLAECSADILDTNRQMKEIAHHVNNALTSRAGAASLDGEYRISN